MAVEVYFWPPKPLEFAVGHASILVEGYGPAGAVYMSVWPGGTSMLTSMFALGTGAMLSYEHDVASEGGTPYKVRMSKLDEVSIRRRIAAIQLDPKYGFLMANCAFQAYLCLHAGISTLDIVSDLLINPNSVLTAIKHTPSYTPWTFYLSAKLLSATYA